MSGNRLYLSFATVAFLTGIAVDTWLGTADHWIHDAAVVYQAREAWPHIAIVALDDGVPMQVGRRQALPLVARAAEFLVQAGAKGVFLDVRLSKEQETVMPYARCLESTGVVQWSKPRCINTDLDQCLLTSSSAGIAPLKMNQATLARFLIAPYLRGQNDLPDFLLYGLDATLNDQPHVAADRLVARDSAVKRWMDLSPDHAVVRLASMADPLKTVQALRSLPEDERCDDRHPCRRIRFSQPRFRIHFKDPQIIAPLSLLASCDAHAALQAASKLQDKVVILQMTEPAEASDLVVTPMTTAWSGPQQPTPGAQFLADTVETLLLQDHPRPPATIVKWILFAGITIVCILIGMHLSMAWLWGILPLVAGWMVVLCFIIPKIQLWPVSAAVAVYLTGAIQVTGLNLLIGLREGRLIRRYMPRQVHDLLITPTGSQRFRNRSHQVVVLMSDLANYTTVTGLLEDPAAVLMLMNDYLQETSLVLQEKYQGWLESYVGDMVCYYWPVWEGNQPRTYHNALLGAVELAQLQRRFFATVPERYGDHLSPSTLASLAKIIDAGTGLATGTAIMGDLGPHQGVRKFGILGDPLNLAARLESLTRHFKSHILIHETLVEPAAELGLRHRRLGRIQVKGRIRPVTVYALGTADDRRFQADQTGRWESWLAELEQGQAPKGRCPDIYERDRSTLLGWWKRGLLREGIWRLDEK